MGGLALAWMVGEGIIIYKSVKVSHGPPIPGALLASSGLFVLLGILAQAQSARFLANALAWGFDAAAFMALYTSAPVPGAAAVKAVAGQPAATTTTA